MQSTFMCKEYEKLRQQWLDFEQFKTRYQKVEIEEYDNNVLKSNPNPVISILIITYQHVDFIKDAIESVISQKIDFEHEIIIGDDDSTDGTREICVEYAKKYPDRIRLFLHRRENNIKVLGRATGIFQIAFNTLISRGKYYSTMSGDDYWTDSLKLSKQIKHLEENRNVSYNYHDYIKFFLKTNKKQLKTKERIQTIVGRNIFQKLPQEFLEIMQEDSFFKFFWRAVGSSNYIKGINPSVVLYHSDSMYTSLDKGIEYKQKMNLRKKIIKICENNNKFKKRARIDLVKAVFYKIKYDNTLSGYTKPFYFLKELNVQNHKEYKLYCALFLFLFTRFKSV